jgi:hypothetical protein
MSQEDFIACLPRITGKRRTIVQPLNAATRIRFYKELGQACVMAVSFLVLSLAVPHLAFGRVEDIDF